VPAGVSGVLRRAFARERDGRYASAREFISALRLPQAPEASAATGAGRSDSEARRPDPQVVAPVLPPMMEGSPKLEGRAIANSASPIVKTSPRAGWRMAVAAMVLFVLIGVTVDLWSVSRSKVTPSPLVIEKVMTQVVTQPPQAFEKVVTREVTQPVRVVEKVVTQEVAQPPQVIEKEVTQIVTQPPQVVEKVVTQLVAVTSIPPAPLSEPDIGSPWTSPADGMVMVSVPAGEFLMGSTDDDPDANADEKPQHMLYVDAFWIDRTEVTNALFTDFVEATGHKTAAENAGTGWVYDQDARKWKEVAGADWRHPRGQGSDLVGLDSFPVVQVSWDDALAYCHWAGRRLPTEAEWEKAARGTDGRKYPWGNGPVAGELVNFCDSMCSAGWKDQAVDDGYSETAPVGSHAAGASPYGAVDMAGNVWEWTADWYGAGYYSSSPGRNPSGPREGQERALRGGSMSGTKLGVRAVIRDRKPPASRYNNVGFRCARSA
jgi:formylglycine-generating enzyme required for sulfatase activity